ncbi:MAG TPA: hypothetical protein VEC11_00855 [Allosphingosinicella sp.]|nr:hypothetical protein [Allosphingosinicella sp.]
MAHLSRTESRMVSGALAGLLHAGTILLLLLLTAVPVPPRLAPVPLEVTFLPAPDEPVELRTAPEPGPEQKEGAAGSPAPRSPAPTLAPAPETLTALPTPLPAPPVVVSGAPGVAEAGTGNGTGVGTGQGPGAGTAGTGEGSDRPAGETWARPDWIVRPTDAQMRLYFPRIALERRTNGVAWLGCQVDANNRARRCRVLAERPRGIGFGAAGLRLSHAFRIRPPQRNGRDQYDAWVRIPIYFEIEGVRPAS